MIPKVRVQSTTFTNEVTYRDKRYMGRRRTKRHRRTFLGPCGLRDDFLRFPYVRC